MRCPSAASDSIGEGMMNWCGRWFVVLSIGVSVWVDCRNDEGYAEACSRKQRQSVESLPERMPALTRCTRYMKWDTML